jgi:tetratricopeptide (TPR) repeat protein
MKKLLGIMVLGLLFFSNVNAEERESELDNLFKQLKNSQTTQAIKIENEIWKIWATHPNKDRKGYRLTELLDQGSFLLNRRQLKKAYEIFSQIIAVDPKWSEAWNKRATVLYLMKQYESSLDDINITLSLEPRHFGALSGQALNYIELTQYEKAIESYKAAQKIYPVIDAAKKMIPQLQELINEQSI